MANDLDTPASPPVTSAEVATFASDGVVRIRGAVSAAMLDSVLELTERQLADPGPWISDTNAGSPTNRLFTSRYLWRDEHAIEQIAMQSSLAAIAAALMHSSTARLYTDHLLVKEPGTSAVTPWHQDIPYWPFLGTQICSTWVACAAGSVGAGSLEFVRGSHRWGKYFAPVAFDDEPGFTAEGEGDECPDIDAERNQYDIVGFDVEPGDALVFSSWIVHGSPGNAARNRHVALSLRWLGDDAVWHPHPGTDPSVTQALTTAEPGAYPADDDRFPVAFDGSSPR